MPILVHATHMAIKNSAHKKGGIAYNVMQDFKLTYDVVRSHIFYTICLNSN